jgi:hypothetical protein
MSLAAGRNFSRRSYSGAVTLGRAAPRSCGAREEEEDEYPSDALWPSLRRGGLPDVDRARPVSRNAAGTGPGGQITNTPLGTMVRKNDKWTMVNQMTGPAAGGTLSHWAYMVQSRPGDRTFKDLPFADESIPEFLSDCPDGPMIQTR